jgi:hypothetical protein
MISVLWLGLLLGAFAETHPDFSGAWEFDPQRSKLEVPPPVTTTMTIRHQDGDFHLLANHTYEARSRTVTFHLTTDGKVRTITEDGVDQHLRLRWQGAALVLEADWTQGSVRSSTVTRFTLSPGGKTLTTDERASIQGRAFHNVWIFRKR